MQMIDSPRKPAILIKGRVVSFSETGANACTADDHFAAIEKAKDAQFGRDVCAALIQLAAAFWRHYVGGEPPFVRGK